MNGPYLFDQDADDCPHNGIDRPILLAESIRRHPSARLVSSRPHATSFPTGTAVSANGGSVTTNWWLG